MNPIPPIRLPAFTSKEIEENGDYSFLADIYALKLDEAFINLCQYHGADKDFFLGLYYEQTQEYLKSEEHLYRFCQLTKSEDALAHLAFVRGRLGRSGSSQEFSLSYQMQLKFWTGETTVKDKHLYSKQPELTTLYDWILLLQYLRESLCPIHLLIKVITKPKPFRPIFIEIVEHLACNRITEETHAFMVSIIPLSPDATLAKHLARYFLFQNEAKEVSYILNFLTHLNDEETLCLRGKYYELVGDEKMAMASFMDILNPSCEESYKRKLIALEQSRSPQYFSEVPKARKKFPHDRTIQCMEAGIVAEKDKPQARKILERILREDPQFYIARRLLMNINEDYTGLYKLFSERLEIEPHNIQMRVLRVDMALKIKAYIDASLKDCEILSKDLANALTFQKAFLEVLFLSRSYKKAVSMASVILKSEPLNPRAYFIKAFSHFRLGEVDQAFLFFEAMESIGPLTSEEALLKGEMLASDGKWETALHYFKEIKPTHREQVKAYLTCLMKTKRENEAVSFFQRMELSEQAMLGELASKLREMSKGKRP